jgi:hypothetical protein
MDIPPEVIAKKNELEDALLEARLVTGIDFGVRDEAQPNPEDLVLRIFVADANNIAPEVADAVQSFQSLPFPAIVIQRVFSVTTTTFLSVTTTTLPDTARYRPILGGVSVASSRFVPTGSVPVGTLGAIVTDSSDPNVRYGLSCFHVLCFDLGRQVGDEIVQPEPSALGVLSGDRVGTLSNWSFPETTVDGFVDAAICKLELDSLQQIADIGAVSGTIPAAVGMLVTKRGRTTGQTFGWISGISGSYPFDFPQLPTVTTSTGATTTMRILKNQIQIHIDFPQSIVFGESGDSGSVVVGANQVVGLYWASGSDTLGDPLKFGVASPAAAVESALGIAF